MKKTIGFITILILTAFTFISGSCIGNYEYVDPGDLVKQDRPVSSFDALDIGGAFEIYLTQGSSESLVVEAGENVIDKIITEVQGKTLRITTEKGCCKNSGKMIIYVTFVDLNYTEISGACEMQNEGTLNLDKLKMEVSGAAEVDLNMELDKLELELSGASEYLLTGSCAEVYIDASGASEIEAKDFKVGTMTIDASGASDCKVYVTDELVVDASGATTVRYLGSPKVSVSKSGASSIKPY